MSEAAIEAGRLIPASRRRRLFATLIDMALVPTLTIVLVMVTGIVEDASDYQNNWWMLWTLLLAIASYLILNGYGLWTRGQTLGKRALGIAIVDHQTPPSDPRPAPLWKLIFLRAWFFPMLFLLPLPWLCLLPIIDQAAIFTADKRCVHDRLCATQVVRLPPH